jgi:serine/threonine-protein kinase mTOR
MDILRANRNSVMAMLEAFVYDPLISWRLLAQDSDTTTVTTAGNNAVEKAVRQSMAAPTPTVGSPVTELVAVAHSEIEGESRLKSEAPRDNLPKLLRLKSSAMESSQETLNSRSLSLLHLTLLTTTSRALQVINRIQSKLNGRDFGLLEEDTTVQQQVDRLICEATSVENLCQVFVGWCPFW